MPNSKTVDTLKLAIEDERRAVDINLRQYQVLCDLITRYQQRVGREPTVEEFLQWREGVDTAVRRRQLDNQTHTEAAVRGEDNSPLLVKVSNTRSVG